MADVEQQKTGCFGTASPGAKKGVLEEFRDFVLGGNFIRVAAAFVIALALERLVTQFVSSFVTPILGIIGSRDFKELDFFIRGSRFTYGQFLDALIGFVMVTLVIFFCLILPVQRLAHRCAPAWVVRFCPYCCQQIPAIATKCPSCCSVVEPVSSVKGA